jgi:hypothetical protein
MTKQASLEYHEDSKGKSRLIKKVSKTMMDEEMSNRKKVLGVLTYIIPESRLDYLGLYQVSLF